MNSSLRSGLFLLVAAGFIALAISSEKSLLAKLDVGNPAADEKVNAEPKLVRISGTIDGSGRFIFTRGGLVYEHKHWTRPANMVFDGEPWGNLDQTPPAWSDYSHRLDLTKAWIAKRIGRDTIALENTPDGFDLYLNDSPNGTQVYEVTIAIPRRR